MKYDVCVVGHLTRDIVKTKGGIRESIGGVAYYSSITLKKLGLKVCVLTKTSEDDKKLISYIKKHRIYVRWIKSRNTTVFANIYDGDIDKRKQIMESVADPFVEDELFNINSIIYYFGPLTYKDINPSIYKKLKRNNKNSIFVLDIQGHLRKIKDKEIYLEPLDDLSFLRHIDILKLNDREARILTGLDNIEEAGEVISQYSKEVLITLGSRGSVVFARNKMYKIPAFVPRRVVDPTGCGDIYTATYVAMRFKGFSEKSSAIMASLLSGLNVERYGLYIPIKIKL